MCPSLLNNQTFTYSNIFNISLKLFSNYIHILIHMQKIMLKFTVQVAATIVELDGEHIGNGIADSEQLSARVCILQRIVQTV